MDLALMTQSHSQPKVGKYYEIYDIGQTSLLLHLILQSIYFYGMHDRFCPQLPCHFHRGHFPFPLIHFPKNPYAIRHIDLLSNDGISISSCSRGNNNPRKIPPETRYVQSSVIAHFSSFHGLHPCKSLYVILRPHKVFGGKVLYRNAFSVLLLRDHPDLR